jgi:inhibitor of KinA
MNYIVQPLGDQAVRIEFTDKNVQIGEHCAQLSQLDLKGVLDVVPGISSITVYYEYPATNYDTLIKLIAPALNEDISSLAVDAGRLIILPVLYNGPDLEKVAQTHSMTIDRVIKEHSQPKYKVQMLGFLPGFPYLSGLPETLHTPRLATPRVKVHAGAVGIGGDQTGVYPVDSPGGWNLIGQTPVPLFSSAAQDPFLLKQGDRLQFSPMTEEEYDKWEAKIKQNTSWQKEVIFDEEN